MQIRTGRWNRRPSARENATILARSTGRRTLQLPHGEKLPRKLLEDRPGAVHVGLQSGADLLEGPLHIIAIDRRQSELERMQVRRIRPPFEARPPQPMKARCRP